MNDTNQPRNLLELLEQIQLEKFWHALQNDLQITQISHFDFVQLKDLESIGMSKPAVRRLLDKIEKTKKNKPHQRMPPQIPITSHSSHDINQVTTGRSKLYNSNISSVLRKSIKRTNSTLSSPSSSKQTSSFHQSVIIRSTDILILKDSQNADIVLGTGHFGMVKKAIWTCHPTMKKTVAIKFLHTHNQAETTDTSDLINEISCMCGLDHENLIKLYGICLDFKQPNSTQSCISMVTELAAYGSLYTYLKKVRRKKTILPVKQLYSYVYQIACGMEYLEMKKLIHRDLACRNILLISTDQVKICDFGMSRNVRNQSDGAYTMTETHKIPCAWYPPESIRNKLFSAKSDVWMFAVTAWEVFTLCDQPWLNMNPVDILYAVENEGKQLVIPYLCSRNFYSLMQKCWSLEAVERPSFQTIRIRTKQLKLVDMKAKVNFNQENKMDIISGDQITIIEGLAARYWWKGQNQRTLLFGLFPRAILDPQRPVTSVDISLPLKNSFIHTGHMSAQGQEKNWGNPGTIDQIFLSNPLDPPDLIDDSNGMGIINEKEDGTGRRETVEIVGNILSKQQTQNNLIDLIDIENSNEQHIKTIKTYQDYSVSIDSFSSAAISTNSPSLLNQNYNSQISSASPELYMNDKYQEWQGTSNVSELPTRQVYRPPRPPQYIPPRETYQCQPQTYKMTENVDLELSTRQVYRPPIPPQYSHRETYQCQPQTYKTTENVDLSKGRALNVDEFLDKVKNDVFNDFDNMKLGFGSNNRRVV